MNNQLDTISKKILFKELEIKNYLKENLNLLSSPNIVDLPIYEKMCTIRHLEDIYNKMNPLSFDPEDFEILFNCYSDFNNFFDKYVDFYNIITNRNFIKSINMTNMEIINKTLQVYKETFESITNKIKLIKYSKKLLNLKNPNLVKVYLIKNTSLLIGDLDFYLINKYIVNLLCMDEYQLADDKEKVIQFQKVLLIVFSKLDFHKCINDFLKAINVFNEKNECIENNEDFFKEKILEIDAYLI